MEIALWIILAVLLLGFVLLASEVIALRNTIVDLALRAENVIANHRSSKLSFERDIKELLIDFRGNNNHFMSEINERLKANGFGLPEESEESFVGQEPQDIDTEGEEPFFDESTGHWYQNRQEGFFLIRVRVHPPKQ